MVFRGGRASPFDPSPSSPSPQRAPTFSSAFLLTSGGAFPRLRPGRDDPRHTRNSGLGHSDAVWDSGVDRARAASFAVDLWEGGGESGGGADDGGIVREGEFPSGSIPGVFGLPRFGANLHNNTSIL